MLELAGCESVETTVLRRRLFLKGSVAHSDTKRVHRRVLFGELVRPQPQ